MVVGIQGIQPEFLEQVSGRDVVTNGVSFRNAAHGAAAAGYTWISSSSSFVQHEELASLAS